MRVWAMAAALAVLASGCMTAADQETSSQDDTRFTCSAAALAGLVGQRASTVVGAEAMRTANARTIRWIRPGDAVTMDYRTDRLNIELDNDNRIIGFRCG